MPLFRKLARWARTTVAAVAVFLVVGIGYWIYHTASTCSSGVDRIADQCIGVTDGSVLLANDLKSILDKIRQENERVDQENERVGSAGPKAVSIAYLIPLPKTTGDNLGELLRHELQGAHAAQLRENQANAGKPLIRLLIVNYGDGSSEWKRVIPDLLKKVDGPERLVATVVTGRTLDNTIRAIDGLRSAGLPVIASRLTGNRLTLLENPGRVEGLARVAPTNNDQAEAMAFFLRPTERNVLLVQDTNPVDSYLLSLGEAFRRRFEDNKHHLLQPIEQYNSKNPGIAGIMRGVLQDICIQKPDVVFFAGRTPALVAFVKELPSRPCLDVPVHVVAGADAVEFPAEVRRHSALRSALQTVPPHAEVSVRYTSQAHPESWRNAADSFAPESMAQLSPECTGDTCYRNLFQDDQMDDGAAIIGHDAIEIAARAIRAPYGINDQPGLIIQEFNNMRGARGARAVPGASGWISLDENGNTVNKAVAILRVQPDGTVQWLDLRSRADFPCVPNVRPC
jgi:hypothetical protein